MAGNRFVCQRMMEVLLAPKQEEQEKINLTKTETEILKDIALGMTTKEIAEKRFSSFPYSQYPPQEHLPQVGRKQRSRGYEICAESRFG